MVFLTCFSFQELEELKTDFFGDYGETLGHAKGVENEVVGQEDVEDHHWEVPCEPGGGVEDHGVPEHDGGQPHGHVEDSQHQAETSDWLEVSHVNIELKHNRDGL